MTENLFINMIEQAIWSAISVYTFAVLFLFLFCYILILADRYGHKWKYFGEKKNKIDESLDYLD